MIDTRLVKLCQNLVIYSCNVQPGENVLINNHSCPEELTCELVRQVYAAGGIPFVHSESNAVKRELLLNANVEQLRLMSDIDALRMSKMQAYIAFRGGENSCESGDVPSEKNKIYNIEYWEKVHSEIRVRKTKWVVLRFPSPAMAQLAHQSTASFENFYFDVCNMDYKRMSKAMDPLAELIEKTDCVWIKGEGTDLKFSIKGMNAIKCDGSSNIPDGEVYTAPVRDSVNGVIHYTAPSHYEGVTHSDVTLTFKDGAIIKAVSSNTERIEKVFATDEGAKYVGEFAIGVNPFITSPIGDILFDEKIAGSFHFTPGACYDECDNGNKSAIHWDLVCIQTPEYGGGEIYFDGRLIRKDGLFVVDELMGLNPDNLK